VKRWVLNPALNCPQLMDDEQSCNGSTFQMAGAATRKLRRPSCVLVEGTSMSWRSAKQRFARPEMLIQQLFHDLLLSPISQHSVWSETVA